MKFDWTVNLGHVLILVGLLVSGVGVYSSMMVRMSSYEYKMVNMERAQSQQEAQNVTILNSLFAVQRDVAVMKDRMERTGIPK